MIPESAAEPHAQAANPFGARDVAAILRERGWLSNGAAESSALAEWLADAAALLGPHAADRPALAALLALIFEYDPHAILRERESHAVLAREGAREVIRALALEILSGGEVDSDRLKEIFSALKEKVRHGGRELYYPLRLALAGRAGEGELDRVILLLDRAAALKELAPVKSVRSRILEFCSALD